jgi:NAD(P)-dependent dehydrogenase (short-subunit alcohol dehydrogenase family)
MLVVSHIDLGLNERREMRQIVVTGAGTGIGRAVAVAFAAEGTRW